MTNLSSIHEAPSHPTGYGKLTSIPSAAVETVAVGSTVTSTPASSLSPASPSAVSSLHPQSSSSTSSRYAGYLHKRSSILRSWRLNYYVLDGQQLCAFSSQSQYARVAESQGAAAALASAQKRLSIARLSVRSLSPSSHSRSFCFTLSGAEGGKEHLFAAGSERERTEWVDAIARAVRRGGATEAAEGRVVAGEKKSVRLQEVMSGKGVNSNALITASSSSSSLASITHTVSVCASSSQSMSASSIEQCYSCHGPFNLAHRPIACHRCSRFFCDSCAPHAVIVREAAGVGGGQLQDGDEERRMCNRCHESLIASSHDAEADSERPDSRRTTKNGGGSDDSIDEPQPLAAGQIFITVPSASEPAAAAVSSATLPPPAPLVTSLSANEPAMLITSDKVEATKELVSPAPQPASPPPSPLSPVPTRPASPVTSTPRSVVAAPPLMQLTVRVPENREKPIVVLSREEIERLERERRRKGLPDPGARMGSVVIGAPVKAVKQPPQPQQPAAAQAGDSEQRMRRPWYACGCR